MSHDTPQQIPLPFHNAPENLQGMALAEALVEFARNRGGTVRSTAVRKQLVKDGILPSGDKRRDMLARKRLYWALGHSGRFIRIQHGVYQLNPAYEPPKPNFTAEQDNLLRFYRRRA